MATFTNAERVAIRKFCGYGFKTVIGLTLDGDYGRMEYVLDKMDDDEIAALRSAYLSNLQDYEDAILVSGENMDTQQAAVWTRNPKEMAERTALYNALRLRLCQALGIMPGPALGGSGRVVRC